MKKQDEGYVLALVLMVIVVLCLTSGGMLSIALRNVQTQQASVERMQEKYTAEGYFEVIAAQLTQDPTLILNSQTDEGKKEELKEIIKSFYPTEAHVSVETKKWEQSGSDSTCTVNLTVTNQDNMAVCAEVVLKGKITESGSEYIITNFSISYRSYETSATASTEGGAGE